MNEGDLQPRYVNISGTILTPSGDIIFVYTPPIRDYPLASIPIVVRGDGGFCRSDFFPQRVIYININQKAA